MGQSLNPDNANFIVVYFICFILAVFVALKYIDEDELYYDDDEVVEIKKDHAKSTGTFQALPPSTRNANAQHTNA